LPKHGDDAKALVAKFRSEETLGGQGAPYSCRFDELSDGERVLLLLYTLLECAGPECTLCLDEPENFLALREIQPWLNVVIDRAQSQALQIVLISHHPELINALAVGTGRWLDRPSGGPTRSWEITDDGSGLAVADLVARGWLHE
jgi:predicted ATPase